MRFFIDLSYNGKAYHGWQNQPDAVSVQEVLEKGLSLLLEEKIAVVGAGRTDAGVHAIQMIAHFDFNKISDLKQLTYKLNSFLPNDIAINKIVQVRDDAHARFDALSRSYTYKISVYKDPFTLEFAHFVRKDLDIDKLNEASKILFNYKNFKCFTKTHTDVKTYNCKMMKAEWTLNNTELNFNIKADRFLRNMVRAIVGTLLDVGTGKMTLEEFRTIIESENRTKAGTSVPGHALYLTRIDYPETIYNV